MKPLDLEGEFLAKRGVIIFGEISAFLAKRVLLSLKYLSGLSSEPISLYINSGGGCVDACVSIIDEMAALQAGGVIISTIAHGCAMSCGALILGFGSRGYRFATAHSCIFLHSISYDLPSDDVSKQAITTEFITKQTEILMKDFARACGRDGRKFPKFNEQIEKTVWLSPEDAIDFGLIDGIYTGEMEESETRR